MSGLRTATAALFFVGEGAAEDRLDVVTIWIEHKCSVVIRPAQTGRSVFGSACLEGGGVECIDFGSSFGCKGGMLFDGVGGISIDPEDRIIEAVADAVCPRVIGHLHHSAHTKRPQSGVVEGGGTADVCDSNAGVVNNCGPSIHEPLQSLFERIFDLIMEG